MIRHKPLLDALASDGVVLKSRPRFISYFAAGLWDKIVEVENPCVMKYVFNYLLAKEYYEACQSIKVFVDNNKEKFKDCGNIIET